MLEYDDLCIFLWKKSWVKVGDLGSKYLLHALYLLSLSLPLLVTPVKAPYFTALNKRTYISPLAKRNITVQKSTWFHDAYHLFLPKELAKYITGSLFLPQTLFYSLFLFLSPSSSLSSFFPPLFLFLSSPFPRFSFPSLNLSFTLAQERLVNYT